MEDFTCASPDGSSPGQTSDNNVGAAIRAAAHMNETSFHMGDTSGIELDVVASKQEPPVAPSPSASQAAIGVRRVALEGDLTYSVDSVRH